MGLQGVGHEWLTLALFHFHTPEYVIGGMMGHKIYGLDNLERLNIPKYIL